MNRHNPPPVVLDESLKRELRAARLARGLGPYRDDRARYRLPVAEPVEYHKSRPERRKRSCGGCGGIVHTRKPEGEPAWCHQCKPTFEYNAEKGGDEQ